MGGDSTADRRNFTGNTGDETGEQGSAAAKICLRILGRSKVFDGTVLLETLKDGGLVVHVDANTRSIGETAQGGAGHRVSPGGFGST